jgi:lipopolysaccharide assembly protein A
MGPSQAPFVDGSPPAHTTSPPAREPDPGRSAPVEAPRRVRHLWVGLIPGMVALVLILVFVFQNLRATTVSFFGLAGEAPLGLALVASALLGGLVVFGFGSVRILQLRAAARRRDRQPGRS